MPYGIGKLAAAWVMSLPVIWCLGLALGVVVRLTYLPRMAEVTSKQFRTQQPVGIEIRICLRFWPRH